MNRQEDIAKLEKEWKENPRWKGVKRGYSAADVVRLRGSVKIEHTLAKNGAEKLWNLVNNEPFVNALGALTCNQAMQQVKAGLKAIYLYGWQVAGDANLAADVLDRVGREHDVVHEGGRRVHGHAPRPDDPPRQQRVLAETVAPGAATEWVDQWGVSHPALAGQRVRVGGTPVLVRYSVR